MKNENATKVKEFKLVRLCTDSVELNELIDLAEISGLNMESNVIKETAFYVVKWDRVNTLAFRRTL